MVVCREEDNFCLGACKYFNDSDTATCTKIERDFFGKKGAWSKYTRMAEIQNALPEITLSIVLTHVVLCLDP